MDERVEDDPITALMRSDNLSFPEAVERLAAEIALRGGDWTQVQRDTMNRAHLLSLCGRRFDWFDRSAVTDQIDLTRKPS